MPEAFLLEVPDIGQPYWEAFEVLGQGRSTGGGMMALPNRLVYSEIVAYARENFLPVDESVTLVYQLDAVMIAHLLKRAKQSAKKKPRRKVKERPATL